MEDKIRNGSHVLFAENRQHQILEMIENNGQVSVAELCERFGVSSVTIRADLRALESKNLAQRTHGGAMSVVHSDLEANFNRRQSAHHTEKKRIASKASKLLKNGSAIILDTGTTMLELALILPADLNLTIVTNDVRIAHTLEDRNVKASIVLVGGSLRPGFGCTVGPLALGALEGLRVDQAFVSANALEYGPDGGFSTPDLSQIEIKKKFLEIATQKIVLMDASKLGCPSFARFASLADIDTLIINNDDVRDDFWAEAGRAVDVILA